jgi:hypothetical protein
MARRTRSERFATPRRMYLCAASLAPGFATEAALHGLLHRARARDQGETEAKERTDGHGAAGPVPFATVVCRPGRKPGLALP